MLEVLDFAHPILTITIILVLLTLLWMVRFLQVRLRVLESRLESLEREQSTMDEQMSFLAQLSQRREAVSAPPSSISEPGAGSLGSEPGSAEVVL
jgi:Tfp pilus assembly protein PilN